MDIKVKYFDNSVKKLEKIDKGDWIDLRSRKTIEYQEGDYFLIPLNVAMELPKDYEAHLLPRSSTFKKWGLLQTNSQGIIDNSYSGDNDEWMLPVIAMRDGKVDKGDRVAQFRIIPTMGYKYNVEITEVDSLDNEDRNGFGSTGKQ